VWAFVIVAFYELLVELESCMFLFVGSELSFDLARSCEFTDSSENLLCCAAGSMSRSWIRLCVCCRIATHDPSESFWVSYAGRLLVRVGQITFSMVPSLMIWLAVTYRLWSSRIVMSHSASESFRSHCHRLLGCVRSQCF
jgi:hypothetical protein